MQRIRISLPRFLPKSEFWSPQHTNLKGYVHRDIQARFFFTDNNFPELRTLEPHFGHNAVHLPMASDTSMVQSLPFEDTPTAPLPSTDSFTSISHFPTGVWADDPGHPSRLATSSTTTPMLPSVDQFSNPFTIVNGIEPYGVPVGIASPTHQPTISNTPKERWYTEYGVDRDANGLFQCPFPGCNKMNKRRDQLWEHWKARHNDDPYRCGLWLVFQYNQSLVERSNSELSNKSWIYNGEKAHTCNAEMATCQVWFVDVRYAWCIY